ncbi:hypothetical protein J4450_02375 [Candidatus Micrarchaeota archaeon]|nr:hypothetical protein [Candidatus Micrarchaeota archaeon]
MANGVTKQISVQDAVDKFSKNKLWETYATSQGGEKLDYTWSAVEEATSKALSALHDNPRVNKGDPFYDLLRGLFLEQQKSPGKKPEPPRESRGEKKAPPAEVPTRAIIEADKLTMPFNEGNLPKLLDDSKIRENPIGGDYTRKNAAIEAGRINAVQIMINDFIDHHRKNKDSNFFSFLYVQMDKKETRLLKDITEKDIKDGKILKQTDKYENETRELVTLIQRYLNFYQNETFGESDIPGSKFKEAMDKFNAYLKAGPKIKETGIVDEQTLGAIAIYYGLARGKEIAIPTSRGKPVVVEPAVSPAAKQEERWIGPDFRIR